MTEQEETAAIIDRLNDNLAVDKFCEAMKEKMAASRAKGKSGWNDPQKCSAEFLRYLLIDHVQKGDPVDVGNFAMMLFIRSEPTWIKGPRHD